MCGKLCYTDWVSEENESTFLFQGGSRLLEGHRHNELGRREWRRCCVDIWVRTASPQRLNEEESGR